MQFTTALTVLYVAVGAAATPVEPNVNAEVGTAAAPVEPTVEGEMGVMIKYSGTCNKSNQQCRYKVNGKTNIAKSPKSPANHKCTATGKCTYDSYNGKLQCSKLASVLS